MAESRYSAVLEFQNRFRAPYLYTALNSVRNAGAMSGGSGARGSPTVLEEDGRRRCTVMGSRLNFVDLTSFVLMCAISSPSLTAIEKESQIDGCIRLWV